MQPLVAGVDCHAESHTVVVVDGLGRIVGELVVRTEAAAFVGARDGPDRLVDLSWKPQKSLLLREEPHRPPERIRSIRPFSGASALADQSQCVCVEWVRPQLPVHENLSVPRKDDRAFGRDRVKVRRVLAGLERNGSFEL